MRTFESICLGIPEILLPRAENDFAKWAVIACDQYTSEPEYWHRVSEIVGDSPSALNLIYPEVYLHEDNPESRIADIRRHMTRYMNEGLFEASEGLVYVERQTGSRIRKGLLACLDLEAYDFRPGSTSLIRATEGTILDRIPPRVRIREGAPLELPHILVLIDDPEDRVIGPIAAARDRLPKLYDFELMMGSGRLAGFRTAGPDIEEGVSQGLRSLADPGTFAARYGLPEGTPVLLYAMGDGNHSFATAKTIWEMTKERASDRARIMDSPLRFALVELVNLRDEALVFEPIHRILFNGAPKTYLLEDMKAFYGGRFSFAPSPGFEEMKASVDSREEGRHRVGIINAGGFGVIEIEKPDSNLAVGTLQIFLDAFLKSSTASLDYVHGTDAIKHLGMKPGNMAFYLPAMDKNQLFRTVILDGALPRKTFSMGEAWEKRFYLEARKLI
ncbi:MAG: DUF1015 domain-containing protein [Candidatus Aminicenantales bacterium]